LQTKIGRATIQRHLYTISPPAAIGGCRGKKYVMDAALPVDKFLFFSHIFTEPVTLDHQENKIKNTLAR
jgi:hypothetical protein